MSIEITMQRIAAFLEVEDGDVPSLLTAIVRLKRRSDTLENVVATYAIGGTAEELAYIATKEISGTKADSGQA